MNIVVPMAGGSERFAEAGFAFPKNLVEVDGRPLLERVLGCFERLVAGGARLTCLVRESEDDQFHTGDVIRLLFPGTQVVRVPALESGAACTVLLAIEHIRRSEPLLIANGDQVIHEDLEAIVRRFEKRGLDGGVTVFDAVHPRWSYVKTDDDGLVIEAAEKRPISRLATAGTYWYRRAEHFLDAAMDMIRKDASVDGQFFICPAYNEMILRQARIGIHEIPRDRYRSLATPQGVHQYEEELMGIRARSAP